MPSLDGAKHVYAGSTVNPQYWILGQSTNKIQGDAITGNAATGFVFGGVAGHQKINVIAHGAAGRARGLTDHGRAATQGYMSSPNDWRNIEMSLGITEWSGNSGVTLHCRGGSDESFAYECKVYNSGRIRLAKKSWHTHHDYWDDSNAPAVSENCGIKFVCFDNGQFVVLEVWIDAGNTNNWRLVKRETDNGFGTGGAAGGYRNGGPGLWGGPCVTLVCNQDTITFKYFSIREINPFISFSHIGTTTDPNPTKRIAVYGDPASGGGFPHNFGGNIPNINVGTGYIASKVIGGKNYISSGGPSGAYEGSAIQAGAEGGTYTGPDSSATESSQLGDTIEDPLITVFKDFYDRYDLIAISANACGVGTYNEAKDLVELFRGQTSQNYLKMCTSGYDAIQVGQKVVTSQSQLFNKIPRRVECTFKKFGSPQGDIYCRIRDKTGALKQELGTFSAAAVGLNDTAVEFQEDDAEYKLQVGDVLWIEYSADGDGTTEYLLYKRGDNDADDAYNSWFVWYTSTTNEDQLNDLAASIYE